MRKVFLHIFLTRAIFAGLLLIPHPAKAADGDPVRGFVSVEAFELRLSALLRPRAYKEVWRIERDVIASAEREQILANVMTLLNSGVIVRSGEEILKFSQSQVRFVTPDIERGYVSDDRDEIPLNEALIGISFSTVASDVQDLAIEWLWFPPGQARVVVEITGGKKPSARYATPQEKTIIWKSEGGLSLPALMAVPIVERVSRNYLPYLLYGGVGILVFAGLVVIMRKSETPGWIGWMLVVGIALLVASFRTSGNFASIPDNENAGELSYRLLRNTYHAFDYRDDSRIYDTLEKSVSGSLLEKVYLEIMNSLELESQGGPRVKVKDLALRKCEVVSSNKKTARFRVKAEWITVGEVTHWGHTHERTNRYEAMIDIRAFGNKWKIAGMELLNEERLLQKVSRTINPAD